MTNTEIFECEKIRRDKNTLLIFVAMVNRRANETNDLKLMLMIDEVLQRLETVATLKTAAI